jgi:hypothetical protein
MMGYGRWHQFEALDDEANEELDAIFSDDALKENVYGISDQLENGDVDEVLDTLYREWRRGARIRKDEVSHSPLQGDRFNADHDPVADPQRKTKGLGRPLSVQRLPTRSRPAGQFPAPRG